MFGKIFRLTRRGSKLRMDLDLGRWISMVFEWTHEEAIQDQPFSVKLLLVSFTLIYHS